MKWTDLFGSDDAIYRSNYYSNLFVNCCSAYDGLRKAGAILLGIESAPLSEDVD